MKTVPTLCATTVAVGASAVGLAFGRLDPPYDASNKRKTNPAQVLDVRPMPSASHTTTATNTAFSFSSPLPVTTAGSSRIATRRSHDGRLTQRKLARRMTSGDAVAQFHDATNDGHAPSGDHDLNDFDPTATLRSRPSWLKKRLSTISTSQASSRNSSPGPMSPSVSASNGSMAFSHDGSTAPMVSKRSPSPLPPNKLVKRSSSVRVARDAPSQSSGSRMPALRRPATSHQRSATLLRRSSLTELPIEDDSSSDEPQHTSLPDYGVQYTQFFSAKVSKEKTLSKKRTPSGTPKAIKRIFPDDTHRPTLLLAKSVSACSIEVDDSSSQDGESVYIVSRPGTPTDITTFVAGNEAQPEKSSKHTMAEEAAQEGRPRRSFSISDLLSRKQQPLKTPGAKLTRKSSKRVVSAPLNTMGSRQSVTSHGQLDRPSKRRDISDPLLRREIYTSHGDDSNYSGQHFDSSPLPPLPRSNGTPLQNSPSVSGELHSSRRASGHVPRSPTLVQGGARPSRNSVAPSEQASTLIGSDNEARGTGSGDEDETDFQSDTVFDSLRTTTTGATQSTSGARGPRIETIFDESPPQISKSKVTALRDLLPKGTFHDQTVSSITGNQSITEEDESVSTPVRTIIADRMENESPTTARMNGNPLFPSLIQSSPPDMPKPLSLGTLEWDNGAEEEDNRWSFDEDDEASDGWDDDLDRMPATHTALPLSFRHSNPGLLDTASSPTFATPQHLHFDHAERESRSTIFDWSEQQPTDKSPGNRTPPRPKTVHGKKGTDGRGSRSVGRRAPSALHARSQSVPVVPDVAGKRSTVVTNKFGTWGVGSKGVTEDWNDDFEFTDISDSPSGRANGNAPRIDSSMSMIVPKTIQEQQSNVLANIGLLREWGLLIEELKEKRGRALMLGVVEGPNASMWEEVDAMIELADQEAEEAQAPPGLSPPSSPGFDLDAFDDVSGPSPSNGRGRRKASLSAKEDATPHIPHNTRPRRKSILPPNHDIFGGPRSSPLPTTNENHVEFNHSQSTPPAFKLPTTRPRKDSEAKARSVIEALQKRKSVHEPNPKLQPVPPTKKVPFDTATLRHIVPYVHTLMRKVKDALREAEGLHLSPGTSPKEPPFSKMFQTENDLATQIKLMTVM
ncbi:uncharacterized protein BDZ99DRAFT_451376 [Mytilinidion resinicola]|uniref:Uncharacterized protein n=1 Tax=Mytilinidion resinicola TaxID=574789 RepID=A0A6A6Y8E4_9PEZI|nr:uncharacterized protein BDZ99DRAFT_451376 [Mytilinidion resinicola]KAF2804879.1 hypothetical protein BDZ99DRAFT_451376 [Mytilinidion resinicola]